MGDGCGDDGGLERADVELRAACCNRTIATRAFVDDRFCTLCSPRCRICSTSSPAVGARGLRGEVAGATLALLRLLPACVGWAWLGWAG
jgi:hypothetical protein